MYLKITETNKCLSAGRSAQAKKPERIPYAMTNDDLLRIAVTIYVSILLGLTGCDLVEGPDAPAVQWEYVSDKYYRHALSTDDAIYAVVPAEGIVRSRDAGATHSTVFVSRQPVDYVHDIGGMSSDAEGSVYATEMARPKTADHITNNRLYRSESGEDWSLVLEDPSWHGRSPFGPIAAAGDGLLYLAADPPDEEKTVYRSTDGGASWDPTGLITVPERREFTGLLATEAGSVLAVTSVRTYVSTDHGHNWHIIDRDFRALKKGDEEGEIWGTSSEFMPDVGEFVPGVYRSLDGGLTWSRTNFPIVESKTGSGSRIMSGLTVTKEGHVYVSLQQEYAGGVFRTRDNGDEWDVVNEGLPARAGGGNLAMVYSLVIAPDGRLLATTGGGVFRTTEPVE